MSESGGSTVAPVIPAGATSIAASSGVVANAVANASLAGAVGQTCWLTGFDITSFGATAPATVDVTVSNLNGVMLHYELAVVTGAALPNAPISARFSPPLKAAGPNTTVTVSCPALGAGNTTCAVNAYGFRV